MTGAGAASGLGEPATPFIARLARRIHEALAPVAPSSPGYALLAFPDHQNVGDHAIWLGETAWLERRGHGSPTYVCSADTYSAEALRSSAPDGPIFLHGGRNFGDLWPVHQRFGERVRQDFPDRTWDAGSSPTGCMATSSALLGRPHLAVGDSNGRLSSSISAWTTGAPGLGALVTVDVPAS